MDTCRVLLCCIAGVAAVTPAVDITALVVPSMLNANEGANATFAVSLSGVPAEDVTITYTHVKVGQAGAVQPLASLISVSPAELVFSATGMAGELKETTLTVIDNTSPSDPSNRELILVSTCEIGGLECNFTVPTLTIQSIDNDNVVLYGATGATFQVAEGQSLQIPVSLQYEPASPYTISFASGVPEGVRVTPQSLQFGPTTYANKQTLTIEAVDDKNARGKPARLVTLSPKVVVDGVERTDVPSEIALTITDNDTPDIIVTSSNPFTSEAGNSSTLRVSLAIQPLSDTTVQLTVVGRVAEINTGQSDSSSITYTANNWNFPIDVQVTGTDNQQVDGLRSFNVRLAATPSGSVDFEGVTGEYTMYIVDNDVAELTVSPPLLETSESDTSGVPFEIMLSTQPKATVELLYTFPNPFSREGTLDRGGQPDTVISDWWNQKVLRKMTGVDDQAVDGDNFYNLTIRTRSADPFWNGITVELPVVNRDNDGYKQVRISPYATRDPAKRIQISELGFRKRSSRGAVDVNVTEASTACYFDGNGDHAACPGGSYTGTTVDGVKNTVWTSILGGIHLDVTFDQPQTICWYSLFFGSTPELAPTRWAVSVRQDAASAWVVLQNTTSDFVSSKPYDQTPWVDLCSLPSTGVTYTDAPSTPQPSTDYDGGNVNSTEEQPAPPPSDDSSASPWSWIAIIIVLIILCLAMLLVYYWNPIKKRRRAEADAPLEKHLPENATVPYSNADDAEISTGGYNVTIVYTDGTEDPPPHSGMRSIERDPYLMTIDANTAPPPNPINPQEHQHTVTGSRYFRRHY